MKTTYFLLFELRGTRYAIDAKSVEKSIRLAELTPSEELPNYFVGLVNIQGRVVPVIDLSIRFGHEPDQLKVDQSIVVIEVDNKLYGILSDNLLDVVAIEESHIESYVQLEGPGNPAHHVVNGVIKHGGQVFILLDPQRLSGLIHDCSGYMGGSGNQLTRMTDDLSEADQAILSGRARQIMSESVMVEEAVVWQAIVSIDAHYFAIKLNSVAEFVHLAKITPIPCCPNYVIGCMNLRGDVITILDMAPLILHKTTKPYRDVMLVRVGDKRFGIAVHQIIDVRPSPVRSINPIRSLAYKHKHCSMVLHDSDITAAVLDVDELMRDGLIEVNELP